MALLCPGGIGKQRASFLVEGTSVAPARALGAAQGPAHRARRHPGGANATEAERELAEYLGLIFTHFRPRMTTLPGLR